MAQPQQEPDEPRGFCCRDIARARACLDQEEPAPGARRTCTTTGADAEEPQHEATAGSAGATGAGPQQDEAAAGAGPQQDAAAELSAPLLSVAQHPGMSVEQIPVAGSFSCTDRAAAMSPAKPATTDRTCS